MLDSAKVGDLKNLIKNSFRVRPNQDPVYIDVADHLTRLKAPQHQVLFGRRGSGKSCLLVHFKNKEAKGINVLPVYINIDEIKKLGFPDILIRLVLSIMEEMPSAKKGWFKRWATPKSKVQKEIKKLRGLLDEAENQIVVQEDRVTTSGALSGGHGGMTGSVKKDFTQGKRSEFSERKLDSLERHLVDFKHALKEELENSKYSNVYVIIDDFYLVTKETQPDVIDYLHRLVRGTDYYLKVGTVRHRTNLIRNSQQTIGVELHQDVEEISLDRTLEDLTAPKEYLGQILDSFGRKVSLGDASVVLFNQQGFEKLVIASGGVPRDMLTICVQALDIAISQGKSAHLTPKHIWKASSSITYRTKLKNLRDDALSDAERLERTFRDLFIFCIDEKKRTCFLISQEDVREHSEAHELILQLMDFKLIHVVERILPLPPGGKVDSKPTPWTSLFLWSLEKEELMLSNFGNLTIK